MANFTKAVSAGSRIYYFDVRTDSKGHQYITITEQARDGRRRSCVFLHPEDFAKFTDALSEAIGQVSETSAN